MKRLVSILVALLLMVSIAAQAEVFTGTADGFGGPVEVTVTVEDGKIVSVEATGAKETDGIGTLALEGLPAKIVEANGVEVDVVSGATYTSKAILAAVSSALGLTTEAEAAEAPAVIEAADAYLGLGIVSNGRIGPGKDDKDVQVYSFNEVYASAIFDGEGKILHLNIDQLEVATPNYDGESMPHLSGLPGQPGYNMDADHDEKVDSVSENTEDSFLAEIAAWKTKRERGEGYKLNTTTWQNEMDAFQKLFVGMTVDEVDAWFAKYTSDVNGRPLKADSSNEQDVAKYNALSDEDKAHLADVTSSATMSLKDGHGDILAAIRKAYENRVPLTATSATGFGLGASHNGRIGPGKDDKEVPVYSFNDVVAVTLFDAEGRIAAIQVDQVEVASPNYDGESMPHFSGYPGQGGYNMDADHDEKVDSVSESTDDSFLADVAGWKTKRERGEGYKLNTTTWQNEMDAFQKLFVGMTVDEVDAWFAKYTSDVNGRPLKADSSNEQDVAKYNALSDEDKTHLADVTSSATMSLKDGHGDILAAIRKSFDYKVPVELTIG